ncbi:MAG: hypothetical protein KatS3mg108_3063 [Isosphaeraceae bacterium]|jgi:hypothetical protein|nr:MAG: hypothetical protein KatS3mg108_3063 [Isosphaeraceae bacterium]
MHHPWIESLQPDDRARVDQLIAVLRSLGCPDPEAWARRELRDNWPQLARYALLHHLWSESINAWSDSLLWIDNLRDDPRDSPHSPAPEAARALDHMLRAGVSRHDIARLARFIAYETVFSVVHTLDEGFDPEREDRSPGWALMELDPLGQVTNRPLTHLHEDLPRLAARPPRS